ncbi:hypothetical protein BV22DRAFT_611197 [Leucogyrophana mollusca]|uniref:Uncharacterized protein n=1 Tax=Leucogyrophana mollusca TaxID=85980 RepID=A0ACB8BBH3_9AGAM|nr:hypothetical protein BV22DRAFT_611197 [Leucogyrophana mollusca]
MSVRTHMRTISKVPKRAMRLVSARLVGQPLVTAHWHVAALLPTSTSAMLGAEYTSHVFCRDGSISFILATIFDPDQSWPIRTGGDHWPARRLTRGSTPLGDIAHRLSCFSPCARYTVVCIYYWADHFLRTPADPLLSLNCATVHPFSEMLYPPREPSLVPYVGLHP